MGSVTLLIGRFQRGSSSAFLHLFDRFLPQTTRLACRRFPSRDAVAQDAEDTAQCVFWELYRAVRHRGPLAANLRDTPTLLTALSDADTAASSPALA